MRATAKPNSQRARSAVRMGVAAVIAVVASTALAVGPADAIGPVNPIPGGLWAPAPGTTPATGSYVYLESEPGDYIGAGGTFTYTKANSGLTVPTADTSFSVNVDGDEWWHGIFNGGTVLQVGYYPDGLAEWFGQGRGCSQSAESWFVIDALSTNGSAVTTIDARFEQQCDGTGPALHGKIHWDISDPTTPPGPITPIPAGTWAPSPGSTPASGSYVYLQSETGDPIGLGQQYTYTNVNSLLAVEVSANTASFRVTGDEYWFGNVQGMSSVSTLQPGFYPNLLRYPGNPARGGLTWWGEGRGCNDLTGWFAVDGLTMAGDTITTLDVRFEQYCDAAAAPLHGKIHWDASDTSHPPGPVNPIPADLWQPAPGSTPATGSYVHIESQPGDLVGGGGTYDYSKANALLDVSVVGNEAALSIQGDERWTGRFQTMSGTNQLKKGYYPGAQRRGNGNPTQPGLDVTGPGVGCNKLLGWYSVDTLVITAGILQQLDVRFEQHCEGAGPALRGKIHWDASDPTTPPGPVNPIPTDLWQPTPAATPELGSYVQLDSDPGDWVGNGVDQLYAGPDDVNVTLTDNRIDIGVGGWSAEFQPMSSIGAPVVGYYPAVKRWPFHNPTRGGLNWSGHGRGCNQLNGWFVIDRLVMSGSTLGELDLRFEQRCDGAGPALRGKVHFDNGNGLHPINPVRVLDSRNGTGGFHTPWAQGQTRQVKVAGVASVPSTARAVVLNLTATDTTAMTYLTAWPAGQPQPLASNLNLPPGDTRANLVVVKVGTGGNISLRNDKGSTHLIADVAGYYDGAGEDYVPVTPARLLDTRFGTGGPTGALGAGQQREVAVKGVAGVPSTATAVVANVTAVGATASTYLTVWPNGQPHPLASNVNVPPGETRPNLVVVKLGTDGKILVRNNLGNVDVVVDIVGYYQPGGGLRLFPVSPTRVLDSRSGTGGYNTPWHLGESRSVHLADSAMAPGARAMVANLTGVLPTAPTHITAWPTDTPFPPTSNLNLMPGTVAANLGFIGTKDGDASIYNNAGDVDVVVDIVGYLR